ncbi:hypothetical protein GN958_ATG17411 [Phytophthora infestans]|uniref:Uncharacterized protein n=1 Tax=Phytophthora infestans TaxID=4787 RepID=A0A8S9U0Z5_PHYIN|nr:hypothetical protein GN958_ATG17411 [Phytophthora infestans]
METSTQLADSNVNLESGIQAACEQPTANYSGVEKCSDAGSSGSRKRDHAECDYELFYASPLRKYYKSWKHLEKWLTQY